MNRVEKASDLLDKGYNCAQSVLASFVDKYNMKENDAFLVSSAFGGGIGRFGKIYGALSGALMVVGLKYGAGSESTPEVKDKLYEMARKVYNEFERINGSAICNELLGVDMSIPEQRKKAGDMGFFKTKCPEFVKSAVMILEAIENQ
jgi:C_GCAxxG_C_C family probable redox protein